MLIAQPMTMTVPRLSLSDTGTGRFGRAPALYPGWRRGWQESGEMDVLPITAAAAGNRVSNRHNLSDNGGNHNHIEEVIHSNRERHEHPVITGLLEQPVNRR